MWTSVNMRDDVFEKLCSISSASSQKRAAIIRFVIRQIIDDAPLVHTYGKGISYQDDYDGKWVKFKIYFDGQECEQNLDLKKLYKFSLSFLVSFGILMYGHLLLEPPKDNQSSIFRTIMDNYTLTDYTFYTGWECKSLIMSFQWHYPRKIQKE